MPSPPGTHGYWERPHSAEKFTVYYRREAAEALLRVAGRQGVCTLLLSVNLKQRILDIRSMFVVEAGIYELKSLKTKAGRFKVKREHRGSVDMHTMSTVQSKLCFIEKSKTLLHDHKIKQSDKAMPTHTATYGPSVLRLNKLGFHWTVKSSRRRRSLQLGVSCCRLLVPLLSAEEAAWLWNQI